MTMFATLCRQRAAVSQLSRVTMGIMQYRAFSSEGLQAFDKLKGALEQYRVEK